MPGSDAVVAGAAEPTRVGRAAHRAGRVLGRLSLALDRIRPWMVLGPLVVASWLVMYGVGRAAQHDGWLYYNSGDGTWYYTTSWLLGHGEIPQSRIGYVYSLVLAPLTRISGPNLLAGMPAIVFFNAIVLTPIALFCIYGLAKGIGGRRFAYVAAAIWVVLPVAAVPYFTANYHTRYVTETLPAVLGLTPLGDFPSMVCLLVTAYFAFRAIANRSDIDALLSGLALGLAIGVKPANVIFLPAPLLALLVARRPRTVLVVAAGLIPSVIALALWKYRGLGYLPAFHGGGSSSALAGGTRLSAPVMGVHLHNYIHFSWPRMSSNIDGLREFTWSRRLLEWTMIAGLIGLFRRSATAAILIGGWLALFFVIKGSTVAEVYGGGFFRYMAPAFPAAFLLALSTVFLVPIFGGRLAARAETTGWPATPRAERRVLGALGTLSLIPILAFLIFSPARAQSATEVASNTLYLPANQFALSATATRKGVSLSWPSQSSHGSQVAYAIYRAPSDLMTCTSPSKGAIDCNIPANATAFSSTTHFTDAVPAGDWVYRVVMVASALPPPKSGDYLLLSKPLTVHVPK